MKSPGRTRKYRRFVQKNGLPFQTRQELVDAVRLECRKEFLEARSVDALDRFLGGLAELKARVHDEVHAHRVLERVLSSLDDAVALASRLGPGAQSAPLTMVSSRVLSGVAEELGDLLAALNRHLNARATDLADEEVCTPPDEPIRLQYGLSSWSGSLREVSWAKPPEHRDLVFLALRQARVLGEPREFRFLAAASLLSGGEVYSFIPDETTVSDVISMEARRMREVALRLSPFWAEIIPAYPYPVDLESVDPDSVEEKCGWFWVDVAVESPDSSDQLADGPPLDEAA